MLIRALRCASSPIRCNTAIPTQKLKAQTPNTLSIVQQQQIRQARTVRVILTQDLDDGKGYAGEVHTVKPGFARNFLIPRKKALYAIPKNFERVGILDPDLMAETAEERAAREKKDSDEDAKAADVLRHYLRNKTLTIWRKVDENAAGAVVGSAGTPLYPGMVDHVAVRRKLSKQLRIDLEDHETVQIYPEAISHSEIDDVEKEKSMEEYFKSMKKLGEGEECQIQLKEIGEYLVKLSLKGDEVGLRLAIMKRWVIVYALVWNIDDKLTLSFIAILR